MMDTETIDKLFTRFQAANPHPKSELDYVNAYTMLVAVVLSAQTTDAGVNKATKGLFQRVQDPHAMVALGEDALREEIKTIGLFRNKAKNVIGLSQQLIDLHDAQVPQSREALEALPGVGRKTASVVLNAVFGHPTIAVDTHVTRLANRWGFVNSKKGLEIEKALIASIPEAYLPHANHWMVLNGRYVCKARNPACETCLVNDLCPSSDNHTRSSS